MEEQNTQNEQRIRIIFDVSLCLGSALVFFLLRFLSSWIVRRYLLQESYLSEELSNNTFITSLCEIPISSWLYPVGTVLGLIFLLSPEVKLNPFSEWHQSIEVMTCIQIGNLTSQTILSIVSCIQRVRLTCTVEVLHYATACIICIICLAYRQLAALILVGWIVQLPILFANTSNLLSASVCGCCWICNWTIWILTHLICCYVIPGIFIIKPMVTRGNVNESSILPTIVLYWAIIYFGILSLWELRRPIKALLQERQNTNIYFPEEQDVQASLCRTENSHLLPSQHMSDTRDTKSVRIS